MRYFVICQSDHQGIRAHIVAEVVRDAEHPNEERETSLASGVAGSRSQILTRAELLSSPGGRQALADWEADDDSEFDKESRALDSDPETPIAPARLRLVKQPKAEKLKQT